MKIIIKKMLVLISITIFLSSSFVNAMGNINNSTKNSNDINIDLEISKKIVNNKLIELGKSESYYIDNFKIINDENSSRILFYIFNLNPQGFIVVSSNMNLPPIIAYSFKSKFDFSSDSDLFIDLLKSDIEFRLDNIDKIPFDMITERKLEWKSYLDYNIIKNLNINFEQWPPEGTTPTEGWVLTTWDQNSPYNDFCPIDTDSGKRSVAGCPAVAMSQILNYHKTINNVYFDDNDDYYHNYIDRYWIDDDYEDYGFPSFPELNQYLSTLDDHYSDDVSITNDDKAAINFACGVAAKQVYSAGGSGTFGVNQAYDAYLKFNCDTIELLDADDTDIYERISDNIKQALPVHLAVVTPAWDAGHNLVIDGYNTDEYYHLNFGWGGPYDAWYLLPDEIPYGLTVIEGVIVDILNNESDSDLNCYGKLNWVDAAPGEILTGNFTVENIGEDGSFLDWKIGSYPDWGEWEFTPSEGFDLSTEDQMIVEVTVKAPNQKGKEFNGGIQVVNTESSGDNHYIQVTLSTPKIKNILINYPNLIKNFYFFLNLF